MADDLLTQKQVAQRWALSERTLERWRCTSEGPVYIKLGSRFGTEWQISRSLNRRAFRTNRITATTPQLKCSNSDLT
jgi:DNA-binding transcriptional regulator LsrR (DeoR family)